MQYATQWLIIYRCDISIYLDFVPPQRENKQTINKDRQNVSVAISMYLWGVRRAVNKLELKFKSV